MSHRSELHKPHRWCSVKGLSMIYIFFIQSSVSARSCCRFSGSVWLLRAFYIFTIIFYSPEKCCVLFLQQIDECTNNPQLFFLFCTLQALNRIKSQCCLHVFLFTLAQSAKYIKARPCISPVYFLQSYLYYVLSMIVLSCIYSAFSLSLLLKVLFLLNTTLVSDGIYFAFLDLRV